MNTPSSPKLQVSAWPKHVAGVVLILSLAAGALSTLTAAVTGQLDLSASAWSFKDIISGKSANRLASELDSTLFAQTLAKAERAAQWLMTGTLDSRVRKGCDPWLFLEDELLVHPNAGLNQQKRLETVLQVQDILKKKGAQLIVATVPDKSRIQHEQLCDVYRPASLDARLDHWESALDSHKVAVAKLSPALQEMASASGNPPFLKSDTHWSQSGAYAAANSILAKVDELGLELKPKRSYAVSEGAAAPRPGDLIRLAGLDWLPPSWQPEPDIVKPIKVQATQAEPSSSENIADQLFGDSQLPTTALIGTSFSRTSEFAPQLEMLLQTTVPNFAVDGGDFWASASKYLESEEFKNSPPRLVIWEIPERVLQMPISDREQSWMQKLAGQSKAKQP